LDGVPYILGPKSTSFRTVSTMFASETVAASARSAFRSGAFAFDAG
jgi:hypothetical protein